MQLGARGEADGPGARGRFDSVSGSDLYGHPNTEIPEDVLDSIRRNRVRFPRPPFGAPHSGQPWAVCDTHTWSRALTLLLTEQDSLRL